MKVRKDEKKQKVQTFTYAPQVGGLGGLAS